MASRTKTPPHTPDAAASIPGRRARALGHGGAGAPGRAWAAARRQPASRIAPRCPNGAGTHRPGRVRAPLSQLMEGVARLRFGSVGPGGAGRVAGAGRPSPSRRVHHGDTIRARRRRRYHSTLPCRSPHSRGALPPSRPCPRPPIQPPSLGKGDGAAGQSSANTARDGGRTQGSLLPDDAQKVCTGTTAVSATAPTQAVGYGPEHAPAPSAGYRRHQRLQQERLGLVDQRSSSAAASLVSRRRWQCRCPPTCPARAADHPIPGAPLACCTGAEHNPWLPALFRTKAHVGRGAACRQRSA